MLKYRIQDWLEFEINGKQKCNTKKNPRCFFSDLYKYINISENKLILFFKAK